MQPEQNSNYSIKKTKKETKNKKQKISKKKAKKKKILRKKNLFCFVLFLILFIWFLQLAILSCQLQFFFPNFRFWTFFFSKDEIGCEWIDQANEMRKRKPIWFNWLNQIIGINVINRRWTDDVELMTLNWWICLKTTAGRWRRRKANAESAGPNHSGSNSLKVDDRHRLRCPWNGARLVRAAAAAAASI